MNKVQVQLYIPATGTSYDILLPRTISVAQATSLLASFFKETSERAYIADANTTLCSMDTGNIYSANMSVEDLHLKNGSKLMLI